MHVPIVNSKVFIKKRKSSHSFPRHRTFSLLSCSEGKRRARKAAVVCMNQQFVSAAHSFSFQLILAYGINYKHFACLPLGISRKYIRIYEIDVCNLIWFSSDVILNNSTSIHTDIQMWLSRKRKFPHFSTIQSDNLG